MNVHEILLITYYNGYILVWLFSFTIKNGIILFCAYEYHDSNPNIILYYFNYVFNVRLTLLLQDFDLYFGLGIIHFFFKIITYYF